LVPDFTVSMPVPVTITAANAAGAWWIMARYFGCKADGLAPSQWATAGVPFKTDMATCVPVKTPATGQGQTQQ
jgi:hypothetical protein